MYTGCSCILWDLLCVPCRFSFLIFPFSIYHYVQVNGYWIWRPIVKISREKMEACQIVVNSCELFAMEALSLLLEWSAGLQLVIVGSTWRNLAFLKVYLPWWSLHIMQCITVCIEYILWRFLEFCRIFCLPRSVEVGLHVAQRFLRSSRILQRASHMIHNTQNMRIKAKSNFV